MTLLLVNLLAKTDLVSKNVSKRGKKVDFGWSLVILTILLTAPILSYFSHGTNPTCHC